MVAAVLRFFNLAHPHQIVFDETYYVKAGYSLITYGYERDWPGSGTNIFFTQGSDAALSTRADYVVHPPFGKWLIGFGQALFGTDNGFGWRFSTALVGVIAVAIVCRIAWRMFRSIPLMFCAGMFVALDGVAIVMSRISILDNHLMIFVLAGFWAVLKDRDWTRERLASAVAYGRFGPDGRPENTWGPSLRSTFLIRPYLLMAGVFIGLGCGVKWSAIYGLAVFGILVYIWDTGARKELGIKNWFAAGITKGGIPAFFNFIPIAGLAYVGAWASWFADDRGHKRGWAEKQIEAGEPVPFDWLGHTLAEWIAYHKEMWEFHLNLDTPHSAQSQPWTWILQLEPVSFYWPPREKLVQDCGAERCVQAITSVGNPAVWWLGAAALLFVIYLAARYRDWRAWAILAGYGATYLPWFNYLDRTIFQFYSVAFVPYVGLALTLGMAWASGGLRPDKERGEPLVLFDPDELSTPANETDEPTGPEEHHTEPDPDSDADEDMDEATHYWALEETPVMPLNWTMGMDRREQVSYGLTLGIVIAFAAFWMPIWAGWTVSYDFWRMHIWLPGW